MGGRASIIYVVGFAVIAGILNVNIARLSTRAVENMIGYGELTTSRNLANAGANVGLAMLNADTTLAENLGSSGQLLTTQTPAGSGGSFTVRMDSVSSSHSRLRSVSSYSTIAGIMSDTVEVTFSNLKQKKFSTLGWMTCTENGVYFITGDTIYGKGTFERYYQYRWKSSI